jgi:2-oxoisovalerate dehydrogenase E1 component alpha subunit
MSEVKDWRERYFPRDRLRGYLEGQELWDQEKEDELVSGTDETIRSAMKRARAEKKPSLEHMFTDVYDVPPLRLRRQKEEMQSMVAKYPEHFPTASHE